MKKHLVAVLLALAAAAVQARTIELEVNGLVCAYCAQGIEKTLRVLPETDGVLVSLEHRLVAVQLKEGKDIADPTLRTAITEAGYAVVNIQRTERPLAEIQAKLEAEDADD